MSAETPKLDTIFCAAIEIASEADRAAYISQACGDDGALRAGVEKLVAAHFQAGSFLDEPAQVPGVTAAFASSPEAPVPDLVAERPGTMIGPYKLLQQIGEGGMGTVWMAEQTQPVQRQVALKLIKSGMDSKQVLVRFEVERQALALMDHPNIAKVLDVGATESGRPYFVMELVKGAAITKYCDEHHLTPKERLELFVPVCQAVQHAHQKGIIHRDLKPSNVMVCLYDGKPVPKVIDFGVAKATGKQLTEKTLFTELGQVVGTLEYMSPEQAELNQLDIDTRSDIYSLGVLLFELLTGTTPLERKRFQAVAFLEVLRLIREEESPRPSNRLSTTEGLPSIAANRGLEPKKLSGLMRGELDWIVMKTLEKDRNRRYETANGLAMDVQRYLTDEPVQACPPSALYRFRKFARRNKAALLTVVLVTAALLVGAAVSIWQAVQATRARVAEGLALGGKVQAEKERADEEKKRADAERDRAEEEKDKATAMKGWRRTAFFRHIALASTEWHVGTPQRAEELLRELEKEEFKDLRGWEFDYLHRVFHSELHSVQLDYHFSVLNHEGSAVIRQQGLVRGAVLSPDGKYGVVSWNGQTAFDLATGKVVAKFGIGPGPHHGHIWAPAFSPDGKCLVTGGLVPPGVESRVWLWNPATGKESRVLTVKKGRERRGETKTVAFSPDGQLVAAAGLQSNVYVWDLATGEQRLHIDAHPRPDLVDRQWRTPLAFGPDGAWLATASGADKTVKLWSTKTGELLKSFGEGTAFDYLAVSPKGKWIAAADDDLSLRVWEVKTGQMRHVFRTRTWAALSLAFSPDETQLAAGNVDATVLLWDLETGQEVGSYRGHTGSVQAVSFSPDGRRLFSLGMDAVVKTWDARHGPEVLVLKPRRGAWIASVSPDGRLVAATCADNVLRVYDAESGEVVWRNPWRGREHSYHSVFSPDGAYLAEGIDAWDRGGANLWDMGAAFRLHPGPVARVVAQGFKVPSLLHPLVAAGMLGVEPSVQVRPVPARVDGNWAGPAPCFVLAYSPDGKHVATSGQERIVRVWNVQTRQQVHAFGPHSRSVTGLVFSRDGGLLVSGSGGWTFGPDNLAMYPRKLPYDLNADVADLKVWDVTNGRELLSLSLPGKTRALALRPDGKVVAAGFEDRTVRLYDTATGKEIRILRGHANPPRAAAWSPDGSRLVTAGNIDDAIKLWDPITGEEILTLARAHQEVSGLTFSPDGRKIVLATSDDVRIWDATPLNKDKKD